MSSRRRSLGGSKRGRRARISPEDDLPLSLVAMFCSKPTRTPKKPTPQKRNRIGSKVAKATTSAEVIDLDDAPECAEILHNVASKVGSFIQSGSLISSDEEEVEANKAKTNKNFSPGRIFISDDSDDDFKIKVARRSSFDACEPSTSAGTSTNALPDTNKSVVDIMEFVDSVLDTKEQPKENSLKDMKSLEDFRKETEEILKNASLLFDEIKTGRKPEPKKVEESPNKVTVGACPICLDSLANRPAAVTVCGHIFCKTCIMETARTLKKCPTCRKAINQKKIHPIYF